MKYQGTNPLEKLRENEPYFFLRAQDRLAPEIVIAYADRLKLESDKQRRLGNDELADNLFKQALGVQRVAHVFLDWQMNNSEFVKIPD